MAEGEGTKDFREYFKIITNQKNNFTGDYPFEKVVVGFVSPSKI